MSKAKRVRTSKSKSLPKKARSVEDRKRAEAEVARLASFPELNPNAVVEVDFDGNIQYANPATENRFPGLAKLGSSHPFFSNWEFVVGTLQEDKKNTFGRETRIGEHWYYQHFYLVPKNQRVRIYTMNIDELKKAEDEVRAMSRFPAENPNPVMRISKDGVILYCNDAGLPILNEWKCQVGQPVPRSWCQLVADVFTSSTKKEFEEEYATRTFSFIFAPIAEGGYVNVYGLDVTEHKRAEEALKQSEEKYRSLFANMMDGYAFHKTIFDDKGKPVDYVFLEINEAFERLTGLSRAKVIGKRATEVLPGIENDPADWLGTYGKAVTTRQPIKFENYSIPLQKWYSVSAYSIEEDYLVVTFEDITERKKAEERLSQQALMLASANDAIIGYDLESQITFWNKGAQRLYGYSAEEVLGKRGSEVLTPTYTGVSREELINRVMSAGHLEVESIRSTRDGRKLNIDTHVILLRDEKSKPIGYLAIDRDITERKQAEEALGKAHEELEMRVQERTKELVEATTKLQDEIVERKRAEEAVKAGRKRFTDILEMLPAYLVLLTPDYHVSYANRFFREHFGEDHGRRCFEYLFGRTEPCEICETYKALKNMAPLEWEWTGPDGRNYYIFDSPFTDVDDSTLIMEVGIDITERKKAEEALQKAHAELETRVEERTRELKEASWKLQAEVAEHKRTEETILKEKQFSDTLINSLPGVFYAIDVDARFLLANNEFARVTGYSVKEITQMKAMDFFSAAEKGLIEERIKQVFDTGAANAEAHLLSKSGDAKRYYFTGVRIERDGVPILIGMGIDITERKQMENALRETRDYLDSLLDYANAPIIVWDPEFKISKFNHAFEHLTGYNTEEVVGKDLSVLFPKESKIESLTKIQRTLTERWEVVEIPIQRKDSEVRTVLWNSANIYAADGKTLMATIAQGQDITERKKAEQSLRESQFDLNRAQAVAKTGSWRLDLRRNELLWSDETYRIFGIPRGTPMTYEAFLAAIHPDDRAHVDQTWKAALQGEPYDIEHRIIVNGEVKWVREKAELEVELGIDALLGGFGTVQEVTEVKEMQAKLEEYSEHLEQLVEEKTEKLKEVERMATIGETAGMVGHDIRNPLQSIEGAVYLAKEEIKSLPAESQERKELNEILGIIEHQTIYIDNIVADLQDFARTPKPQPKEVEIQELVVESLAMVDIPENVQVQTAFQESLSKLTVDPVFMKRVFVNLIENAVQAMPNGGKLTLKVFRDEESTRICVEDTGVGISEEHKTKMFTPLFSTKSKGQGFGLSVCKKLVEAHKGEITFESKPGSTTFKIKLPLKKNVN